MADEEEEAPPQPVWEGPFDEEGLPHGKGIMRYPPPPLKDEEEEEKPGDTYEGEMVHGKRSGKGVYKWGVTGAVYEGSYEGGAKHGKGKMTFPDKSVYQGDFVQDALEGYGVYTYANGDVYKGNFVASKRQGKGAYHYKEAVCQLVGEWDKGLFTQGCWIYRDGSTFNGQFDGIAPERGSFHFSTSHWSQGGTFVKGEWVAVEDPTYAQVGVK